MTSSQPSGPAATKPSRVAFFVIAALFALFVLCVALAWNTRDAMSSGSSLKARPKSSSSSDGQRVFVDLSPWQTAQAVAALAVTAEESEYAREAERLADHEVDQAFAAALRQATTRQHVLTGEALRLSQKLEQLQQLVKEDQAHVQSLTQPAGGTSAKANQAVSVLLSDDLDVAKAQLGLDSDELADAQQDLARTVGDERTRIQQELAAHEATMRDYDAKAGKESPRALASAQQSGSTAKLLKIWMEERSRYQLIQRAMQESQTAVATLALEHSRLEGQANANGALTPPQGKAATLASLNGRAAQRQLLSIYDDRIQTEQQLASVYGRWSAQLLAQHRIVSHLLLQDLALIVFLVFFMLLLDAVVYYAVNRPTLDRRRMHTLRIIFNLAIQVIGVVLILLVIFGLPSQMPAIIGLTTAGATVVLQDFILAFLGWFILIGKNGIRIGDWVEINGIGGEVVETGVIRTVMLETGNWTDKGYPTGRRVTLMNSFAIKGQYFNFSTTGQWMWDTITLTIPRAADSYRTIELIHNAVLKETETDARLAEQEWKRVAQQNSLGQFTAAPGVDMRPGIYGIDIIVRYVTRASHRFEVRNRMYQCVIALLREAGSPQSFLEPPPPTTA